MSFDDLINVFESIDIIFLYLYRDLRLASRNSSKSIETPPEFAKNQHTAKRDLTKMRNTFSVFLTPIDIV